MDPPTAVRPLNIDDDERRIVCELLDVERFRLTAESRQAEDALTQGRLRRRLDLVERMIGRFERTLATVPKPVSEASMR